MTFQKKLVLKYIEYFNLHDVKSMSKLFDESVELQDWETNSKGINDVVKAFQKIFDMTKTIKINLIKIYESYNTIIIDIEIFLNKHDQISVVDIIEFNSDNKIKKIRAFKG